MVQLLQGRFICFSNKAWVFINNLLFVMNFDSVEVKVKTFVDLPY